MSMFQNPGYLNLARQFMARPGVQGSPYAGRYPDMAGFSRTPAGRGIMQRVLEQMRQSKLGMGKGRRPRVRGMETYGGPTGPYTPPTPGPLPRYTPPTSPSGGPYRLPAPYQSPSRDYATQPPSRQVKRETTEYFDGQQAPSNVGRRP